VSRRVFAAIAYKGKLFALRLHFKEIVVDWRWARLSNCTVFRVNSRTTYRNFSGCVWKGCCRNESPSVVQRLTTRLILWDQSDSFVPHTPNSAQKRAAK
jgi:hypothetical protein